MSAQRRRPRRPSAGALLGMVVASTWVLAALIGPLVAPYDPNAQRIVDRLGPPFWLPDADPRHLLGTDELGRDILSRLLYGTRIALIIGVTVVAIAGILGTTIGLAAGYYRGAVEVIAMRAVDVFLAFPFLLLALALLAVVGSSLVNVIVVLGFTTWVGYARVARAEVLTLREREFVVAAISIGARGRHVMVRHILPNLAAPLVVLATLEVATAVLAEASLTFIGLGIPLGTPTWGQMLASGRQYLFNAWWVSTLPGATLFAVVLGVNLLGDWLRDTWDPRLRRS